MRDVKTLVVAVNTPAGDVARVQVVFERLLRRAHSLYKHVINVQPNYVPHELLIDVVVSERERIVRWHVPTFAAHIGRMSNAELINMPMETVNTSIVQRSNNEVDTLAVSLKIQGVGIEVMNGDFVVLYDVQRKSDAGEIYMTGNDFVHYIAPMGLPESSTHVCLVIDTSRSMLGSKWQQTKNALSVLLRRLDGHDRFSVVTFASHVQSSGPAFASAKNVRTAIEQLERMQPVGGTAISAGLAEGLRLLHGVGERPGETSQLIFLTDGQPTSGITEQHELVEFVRNANDRGVTIAGIAFGDAANSHLVDAVAQASHGRSARVYEHADADLQLKDFLSEIFTPLLRDMEVDYDTSTKHTAEQTNVLYSGSEVVITGKRLASSNDVITATVTGTNGNRTVRLKADTTDRRVLPANWPEYQFLGDKQLVRRLPSQIPILPQPDGGIVEKIWGYREIRRLSERTTTMSDKERAFELIERMIHLGIKYSTHNDALKFVLNDPTDRRLLLPVVMARHNEEQWIHENNQFSFKNTERTCRPTIIVHADNKPLTWTPFGQTLTQTVRDTPRKYTVLQTVSASLIGNHTAFHVICRYDVKCASWLNTVFEQRFRFELVEPVVTSEFVMQRASMRLRGVAEPLVVWTDSTTPWSPQFRALLKYVRLLRRRVAVVTDDERMTDDKQTSLEDVLGDRSLIHGNILHRPDRTLKSVVAELCAFM